MPNWRSLIEPLLPAEAIKPLQDSIDSPTGDYSPWEARLRGFGAGALEGLRQQTDPLSLAALAAPAAGKAVKGVLGLVKGGKVAPGAAQGLKTASPGLNRSSLIDNAINLDRQHGGYPGPFKSFKVAGEGPAVPNNTVARALEGERLAEESVPGSAMFDRLEGAGYDSATGAASPADNELMRKYLAPWLNQLAGGRGAR